jgi:hypothetical protein
MIDNKYINKEVSNISYIYNDHRVKSKYGYGYGYGYGAYSNGYHENGKQETFFGKIVSFIKPKKR